METLLRGSLSATGRVVPEHRPSSAGLPYDVTYCNADHDLAQLAGALGRVPDARLCLYGPPGTGKTRYAQHLAEQLDRPLTVARASNLLGRYVGETEQAIAEAFREAQVGGAILFLDEADSFLADRANARHSWEVTAVNELLVQMEAFGGCLLAATNRMEGLDPAALRRFDYKIRFGTLTADQASALFLATLKRLGDAADRADKTELNDVRRLRGLVPGDFAVAARQARLAEPERLAATLMAALRAQTSIRSEKEGRAIGFTAGW